jgi:hypothetical protein
MWFEENLWIPDDGRVSLIFDIDKINACKDMGEARSICERLHKFNAMLIKNRGRLCIIDNDAQGNNRVFGNFDGSYLVKKNMRSIKYGRDNSSTYGDGDGNMMHLRPLYEPNSFWGRRCRQWRRLMYP